MTAQDILNFWFVEIDSSMWFTKDERFDETLRTRFSEIYKKVLNGETSSWRKTPEGRLAEIIVLDQFSRNIFRNSPEAFKGDDLALRLAEEAVATGDDMKIPIKHRSFMYMPFMHSEDPKTHIKAIQLFSQKGLEYSLDFELKHKAIIDRFGRYPHRNKTLNRISTPEEIEFLKEKGSSF